MDRNVTDANIRGTNSSRSCQRWNVLTSSRSKRMNSRPDTNVRKSARWSWLQTSAFLPREPAVSLRWLLLTKNKQVKSICSQPLQHEKQSQYHMASISKVSWLTWNNTFAVTLGSRERGADSSLESSHSVPGTTTHDLQRKQRSVPLITWSLVLNVFDCVTEGLYFGRDWLRCAEARRSDGRPLSWWSEAPGPSSQRRCPAACSAGNGPWYHMHEVTRGTGGVRKLFKKRIFIPQ